MRGLMNKNRIRGVHGRTSGPQTVKSIPVISHGRIFGGRAQKARTALPREACAVSLTKACHDPGTDEGGNQVTAAQESAEGIGDDGNEPGDLGQEPWAATTGGLTVVKGPNGPLVRDEGKWKGD